MPSVNCVHCNEAVPYIDDRAPVRCSRCGSDLGPPGVHGIPAVSAGAIQSRVQPEYLASRPTDELDPTRGSYASWDDFRSNSPALQNQRIALAAQVLPDLTGLKPHHLPENVPDSVDELGRLLGSFSVPSDTRPAGVFEIHWSVYAAILCAAMVLIAFLESRGQRTMAIVVLAGSAAILIGLWWRGHVGRSFRGSRLGTDLGKPFRDVNVWLYEDGILWQHGTEMGVCRWAEVEDLRVSADGAQPRYVIVPREGIRIVLSQSWSPAIMPVAEYMEIKIASAQLLPMLQRVVAGERLGFGVVALDRRGFASPGFSAGWADLVRVVEDRANIYVVRTNQAEWHMIRSADVSFTRLVPAIAYILIEEASRLPA